MPRAGALVWPGPSGIRVASEVLRALGLSLDDGSAGKRTHFVERARHADEAVALGAVVILGERGSSASLARIEPAAAVPHVLPSLIFGGSDRLADAFRGAARLASLAPCFRASLPDDLGVMQTELSGLLSRLAESVAARRS
jgi:hypothetical protein